MKNTVAGMELLEQNRMVFKGGTNRSKGVLTRMGQSVEESLSLCPDQSFSEVLEGPCTPEPGVDLFDHLGLFSLNKHTNFSQASSTATYVVSETLKS